MSNIKYIGTLDTGKSNLRSRAEFKLDKGGVVRVVDLALQEIIFW